MKIPKIKEMSVSWALIVSALIISLTIFLTVLVFFGGDNNRQKLFIKGPAAPRTTTPTLSPEQVKKIQEQRAAQQQAAQQAPKQEAPAEKEE